MLTQEDIDGLLTLQRQAYELLMWLADAATIDPEILSPETVAALRKPKTAELWLEGQWKRLPGSVLPADPAGAFANLLASFFATSFSVKHLEFDGRLVEARVMVGVNERSSTGAGLEYCQALAL